MATDETQTETLVVHPGDVIQDRDGLLYLVTECHGWGVGAILRWRDGEDVREHYFRFKPGSFALAGAGAILPPHVAAARRDSIATMRDVERDRESEQ